MNACANVELWYMSKPSTVILYRDCRLDSGGTVVIQPGLLVRIPMVNAAGELAPITTFIRATDIRWWLFSCHHRGQTHRNGILRLGRMAYLESLKILS